MFLGSPLSFALGGGGLSIGLPWIVNISPAPGSTEAELLGTIKLSVRDAESGVDPGSIRVTAGFAKIFSDGSALFDSLINTSRIALDTTPAPPADISLVAGGVKILKTSNAKQRSIYATYLDADAGYESAMFSSIIEEEFITAETAPPPGPGPFNPSIIVPLPVPYLYGALQEPKNGTIFGIEHGPRNKVVYIWLQEDHLGNKLIRATSYLIPGESPLFNTTTIYNWSGSRTFTVVWNEAESIVEVYVSSGASTDRALKINISDIPDMPSDYYARAGDPSKLVAVYGQRGASGDYSIWSNVAFTKDVGYPVVGLIRPGDFDTKITGAVFNAAIGNQDPRDNKDLSWFTTPSDILNNKDPLGTETIAGSTFIINKLTSGKTNSIYRQEPGLLDSSNNGFMVQARISTISTNQTTAGTGSGITIFDGTTVFQLHLFDNHGDRTIGLLKKDGAVHEMFDHFIPDVSLDWTNEVPFRFVVDPRRNSIRLYGSDLSTPVMDIPFDRNTLPDAADFDWLQKIPFIIFGYTVPIDTLGSFHMKELSLNHLGQYWDSSDGLLPSAVGTNPIYTQTLTGGSSTSMNASGYLSIESSYGNFAKINRAITNSEFEDNKSGILEARFRVSNWRKNSKTGVYAFLDDGLRVYGITFVENSIGKFVCLALKGNAGGFSQIASREGAKLSFLLDWSEFHTYRIERSINDGLKVFVDDEQEPRIVIAEANFGQLPDPQFAGTPSVAFGHYTSEGAISEWDFVRTYFSRGYDISFKKSGSEQEVIDKMNHTQILVVAHAMES